MQVTKFYTYYLKNLFKSWWFWIGAILTNISSFWWRFQFNKEFSDRGYNYFHGYKVDPESIPTGEWKIFWNWIFIFAFFYLLFWLILGLSSTIGVQAGTLIGEPKENGEDAFFLSYTSPIKRSDLIWGKLLAGFTFFMLANLIYSLSAIYWWIRNSQSSLDYLFIIFQIFLFPILIFCLLVIPLFYLSSLWSAKAIRIAANYIIPIISFFSASFISYKITKNIEFGKAEGEGFWNCLKLFDYSFLIFLVFALFSLLIGLLFYYLYQKNFQEKDIN